MFPVRTIFIHSVQSGKIIFGFLLTKRVTLHSDLHVIAIWSVTLELPAITGHEQLNKTYFSALFLVSCDY